MRIAQRPIDIDTDHRNGRYWRVSGERVARMRGAMLFCIDGIPVFLFL